MPDPDKTPVDRPWRCPCCAAWSDQMQSIRGPAQAVLILVEGLLRGLPSANALRVREAANHLVGVLRQPTPRCNAAGRLRG